MKRYSFLLGIIVTAIACSSLLAQEKPAIQPNATVLSILQANAGKTVELHLRSGEKIGGESAKSPTISSIFPISPARSFTMLLWI
jgi:hypothetical protein